MPLTSGQITDTAATLRHAYKTNIPIAPLRETYDMDINDAYAVQAENTKYWLSQGRVLSGRKIGFTSKETQEMFGINEPDFGMLFSDMAHANGETISIKKFLQPRIESEIAFCLKKDLNHPDITITEILSAIEYAVVAFEIADSRIADWNIHIQDTVADNASSGAYILGDPVRVSDFDHEKNYNMQMTHNGEQVSTDKNSASLGNPINACLWLAKKMVEVKQPLKAGDIILSGALGSMVPVESGKPFEVEIEGLGSVRTHFED